MTLDDIKAECREIIRLGELATEGKWEVFGLIEMTVGVYSGPVADCHQQWTTGPKCKANANLIAKSRTFSPESARQWLEEIEWLECQDQVSGLSTIFRNRLEAIRANWSREK